jgi:methylenetetrahydrofolate reductase (NADPH)
MNLSFELFPPKTWDQSVEKKYISLIKTLVKYQPNFISCTYGANGGTKLTSLKILLLIKKYGGVPLAHCTLANQDFKDVQIFIQELYKNKIKKILCLRGDIDTNAKQKLHANDLMQFIQKTYKKNSFEIYGA